MINEQVEKIAESQYEMGRIFAAGFRDGLIEMGLYKEASVEPANLGDSLRERWGLSKSAMGIPASYAQEKNYGGAYNADTTPKEGEDAPATQSVDKPDGESDDRVKAEGGSDTSKPNGLAAGAVGEGSTANPGSDDTSSPAVAEGAEKSAEENPFLRALKG